MDFDGQAAEPEPVNYDLNGLTQLDAPQDFDYLASQQDLFNPIEEESVSGEPANNDNDSKEMVESER